MEMDDTPMQSEAASDVTQADRDAATIYRSESIVRLFAGEPDGWADTHDDHLAKAFARHRIAAIEECAKVADGGVQLARDHVGQCKNWSVAQGEWSRARDLGLDIADAIRALGTQDELANS